jgi:predicted porin
MKMKSKLIALAVSSAASVAVVAPAFAGDVTVYGRVQVEVGSVSYETENPACAAAATNAQTVANGCDGLGVVDNSMGRIGFKASEDLGNGWKGLAKYELKADTANGGVTGARESLVGLKGSAVTIELGNLKSAYKYAGGVKYDPFVATTLEARGNGGMSKPGVGSQWGHSSFIKNSVGVQGGSGPIKARLTYAPADGDGDMSLSVMYSQGAIEAFVAMVDSGDQLDTGAVSGNSYSATKIGGAFKSGPHKITLQYEMTDEDSTSDPTFLFVGYQMKMGKNTFVAQLGQFDADDPTTPNADADMVTLGVIHKMSKMTRIFGGLRQTGIDDKSGDDVISIGVRKDF